MYIVVELCYAMYVMFCNVCKGLIIASQPGRYHLGCLIHLLYVMLHVWSPLVSQCLYSVGPRDHPDIAESFMQLHAQVRFVYYCLTEYMIYTVQDQPWCACVFLIQGTQKETGCVPVQPSGCQSTILLW